MNSFRVSFSTGELSLPLCVASGQVFRWRQLDDGAWLGVDGERWYRAFAEEERGFDEQAVLVDSNGTDKDFKRLFRLDADSVAIKREILELGPELKPYLDGLQGLRVMRPSSPVETFFCFLCTPNNNVARITGMVAHLGSYGEVLDWVDGNELRLFPTVERIASIPESELRQKAFGYRGATIPHIANELLRRGGAEYLAELKSAGYEAAHSALCSFKGIGAKLADCICLFALDQMEAVPVDTHLWQAACRLYFPQWQGTSLTDQRYRQVGTLFRERFGQVAGWAHQYLFYDNLLNRKNRQ